MKNSKLFNILWGVALLAILTIVICTNKKQDRRNFLIVSDSYGAEGNTYGDYNYDCWKFPHWTQVYLNIEEKQWHNFAISGEGFISAGGNWIEQINNEKALEISQSITDILVIGGLNDSVDNQEQLNDSMVEFYNYARENYPNATIWLGYVGNALEDSECLLGRNAKNREKCKNTYENQGEIIGYKIIPGLAECWALGKDSFYEDGVHPTFNEIGDDSDSSAKIIGKKIADYIK